MKITGFKDHMQPVYDRFPLIHKKACDKVCMYGLRKIVKYIQQGHDLRLFLEFGEFIKIIDYRTDIYEEYYRRMIKKHNKLKMLYKLQNKRYDGYYYFGLTKFEYQDYLAGIPLNKTTFYKNFPQTRVRPFIDKVLRVPIKKDYGWFIHHLNYTKLLEPEIYWEYKNKNEE